MKFNLKVRLDQVVTKELTVVVEARTKAEAQTKAREALQTFPEAHAVEGVSRIEAKKHSYWIPRTIDFIEKDAVVA